MFTSMDLKVDPLHCNFSDIGYVSGGEVAAGSGGSTYMVGIGGAILGVPKDV